jgi:hypothetical protein
MSRCFCETWDSPHQSQLRRGVATESVDACALMSRILFRQLNDKSGGRCRKSLAVSELIASERLERSVSPTTSQQQTSSDERKDADDDGERGTSPKSRTMQIEVRGVSQEMMDSVCHMQRGEQHSNSADNTQASHQRLPIEFVTQQRRNLHT